MHFLSGFNYCPKPSVLFILLVLVPARWAQRELAVRLIGGQVPSEGQVQVYHDGYWGNVCTTEDVFYPSTWDMNEAQVVCAQLGYTKALSHKHNYPQGRFKAWELTDIVMKDVTCSGDERLLSECQFALGIDFYCEESGEYAQAVCLEESLGQGGPQQYDIQLVNGTAPGEGLVQIYLYGVWESICSQDWNLQNALVICRQLGYSHALDHVLLSASSKTTRYSGVTFAVRSVVCTGLEDNILQCDMLRVRMVNDYRRFTCNVDHQDAGVVCSTEAPSAETIGTRIQLTGDNTHGKGRVQVFAYNQWWRVCNHGWTMANAYVACRQLGFDQALPGNSAISPNQGTLQVAIFDDIGCSGSEGTLAECKNGIPGMYGCSSHSDAVIVCQYYFLPVLAPDSPLRIIGTRRNDTGRVEIYHTKRWWTICGYHWDIKDVYVVCQQLGFASGVKAFRTSSTWPAPYSTGILMSNVTCTGHEEYISQCEHGQLGVYNCDHSMDAGVECSMEESRLPTSPAVTMPTPEFSLRLVDGLSPSEGRVEVFIGGQWGTICDDGWDFADADLVCRGLGYSYSIMATKNAYFGAGEGPVHMRYVNCPDTVSTIEECDSKRADEYCSHSEDAGAICSDSDPPIDFDVRLIGSIHRYIGYVQVYYQGTWGYICNDGWNWDMKEADVVCKEMGYEKAFSEYAYIEHIDKMHFVYTIDGILCSGSEPLLRACDFSRGDECYGNPATVVCSEVRQPARGRSTYSVRLKGGSNFAEGRVEVYLEGAWGTVCDDNWNLVDAFVVCRQLGFFYALSAPRNAAFGEGVGRIELDDVACSGLEDSLVLCSHPGLGYSNCAHHEDAGVVCSDSPAPQIGHRIRIIFSSVKVNQGRVEVHYNNLWWRVCNQNWDDADAEVVCRQENFRYGISLPFAPHYDSDYLPAAYLQDVTCSGSEDSLANCQLDTVRPFSCPFYRDAAVYCSNNEDQVMAAKTQIDLSVRLSGGRTFSEGRVEVYSDGRWWAICSNEISQSHLRVQSWSNEEVANVVCRQLGFNQAVPHVTIELLFDDSDPESIHFLLSDVRCSGTETSLSQCRYRKLSTPYKCTSSSHQYFAAVQCKLGLSPLPTDLPEEGDLNTKDEIWIVLLAFSLSVAVIIGGTICLLFVCLSCDRPPEWTSAMIWNRPCSRRSQSRTPFPLNEPWAPRAATTSTEQLRGRAQHEVTFPLQARTSPYRGPYYTPPPQYRNVIEHPENFPVPVSTAEEIEMRIEAGAPPSYSNAINEYSEVREEYLSRFDS